MPYEYLLRLFIPIHIMASAILSSSLYLLSIVFYFESLQDVTIGDQHYATSGSLLIWYG